jgi:hypothetical protein
MNTAAIRQQLHQYIDVADDKKIEAIYTLLENSNDFKMIYSDEELKMFRESAGAYLSGDNPGYTIEEAHDYIRKARNKE